MSYHAEVSFKTIPQGELYAFLQSFKKATVAKLDEIAKDEFLYMPSVRKEHIYKDANPIFAEEADEQWARAVFTNRFFYLAGYNLLGVFGVPQPVQHLFDASCYFQNSTDQDYDFDEWKGVPAFEEIANKWRNSTDQEVIGHYESRWGKWDCDSDCDYYRRTFAYDDIWGLCEKYLWQDEEVVNLALFGHYELYKLNAFRRRCLEHYEKWLKE